MPALSDTDAQEEPEMLHTPLLSEFGRQAIDERRRVEATRPAVPRPPNQQAGPQDGELHDGRR